TESAQQGFSDWLANCRGFFFYPPAVARSTAAVFSFFAFSFQSKTSFSIDVMADNKDSTTVPGWDGSARGWRRYTREVSWFVQATPIGKRRYCASKLISRLSGPARLLAMSWSVSKATFDDPDGTRLLLQRLASSPLVRKTLPNAAAICQQYFSFRRSAHESIGNFLVRETLVHEEFVEAIIRLHEEKLGVSQDQRDYGLPDPTYEEDSWSPWWDWPKEDDDKEEDPTDETADVGAEHAATPIAGGTRATTGSSPSHRGDGAAEAAEEKPKSSAGGAIDELSVADSFIMGVLRGWRLLQAAGLTAEEKRDILSTTKNSLEYETVASALQSLWDEQLLGQRGHHATSGFHLNHLDQNVDEETYGNYEDDWSWGNADDGGWYDSYYAYEDPQWWSWDEEPGGETPHTIAEAEIEDPALKEAQQAEQVAEALALEAQRTWSQAQKATQALRKDRGFGAITGRPQPNDGRCFNCGGPHLQRDCPDLRHRQSMKGKGKMKGFWNEMDDYYANFSSFGKSKSKGKSKKGHWMDVQGLWKGKGKGPKGKTKDGYRTVNAYSSEMFLGGLEVIHSLDLAASSTPSTSSNAPQLGMLDCGATASAAPEAVVKGLISSVLSIDRGARIDIDQYSQPFFRFGNGKWGKALCRVLISSSSSGRERQFALYTLPNPAEYFQNKLDKASLVPVLIGMDFLGPQGQGMMIDFNTGLAMFTKTSDPRPPVQQLQMTSKGHYVLNLATYLTGGRESTVYFDMSASDHVMPTLTAVSSDDPVLRQPPQLLLLDPLTDMSTPGATTVNEEIYVAEIKSKTPKAKAKAMPLDFARKVKGDNRDPRASSTQWPCFNRHVADYPKANAHGRWTHCCICNLRLEYVPRQGSHGQTTQNQNPAMVRRMLTQLQPLMGANKPTAAICLAMQRKIDAEEQLMHMINEHKNDPTRTIPTAPQTASPGESSNSSWQMTGDTEDTNLAMAYEADGYQGQQ
ncbi:unnamed protein product, partial [Symbiodinium sp. KB8]